MGGGTSPKKKAEPERPYLAAESGKDRAYKAGSLKARGAGREKTRMVDLRRGKESFVFLGGTIRKKRSILRNPRMHFMQRWPSPKAMKRIRERVHELTDSRHGGKDVKQIIVTLNPVLRGWGNYFRTGNAERKFNQLDSYVWSRLTRWMFGAEGNGLVDLKSGPMKSLWVWVCISCAAPCGTRRKLHQ
jgi:hypothetical protein